MAKKKDLRKQQLIDGYNDDLNLEAVLRNPSFSVTATDCWDTSCARS